MKRTRLHPSSWVFSQHSGFAQGVQVGGTVYVSGMVAFDDDGILLGVPGDMNVQSRQTFRNIATILAEAKMSLHNVVKITCYITDASKYQDYAAVRSELFHDDLPASATVVVAALVAPGAVVEIDAIAVRSDEGN